MTDVLQHSKQQLTIAKDHCNKLLIHMRPNIKAAILTTSFVSYPIVYKHLGTVIIPVT